VNNSANRGAGRREAALTQGPDPGHLSESILHRRLREVEELWRPVASVQFGACRGAHCIDLEAGGEQALRATVDAYAQRLGGVDPRIAASALMFPYAKALVAPAIATLVVSATIPDLAAKSAVVEFTDHPRPTVWLKASNATTTEAEVAEQQPASLVPTRDELIGVFITNAFDKHLLLLVDRIHETYRLSRRVLLANAAYVLCTQFSTLKWVLSEFRDRAAADAMRLVKLSGARFDGLGAVYLIDQGGQIQVRFERTNCCLFRLIPGEEICDGCSFEVHG
jgi:ferric iron reductase protein FhuF